MVRRSRTWRAWALAPALVVIAAACGARVSEEQVQSLQAQRVGEQRSSDGAEGQTAGDPSQFATGGDGSSSSEGGAASPTLDATSSGGPTPSGRAPAGGNGGATDVGVTADTVVLGNVATLSGPVPGIFQGATLGAQAVVAYQNSKGGLYGREFKLDVRDDQFDTGQNRSQTIDLLSKAFAFVGSFSLFDDAAAQQIAQAKIPDVSYALSVGRRKIPNNYSVEPSPESAAPSAPFNYFNKKSPSAVKAVGTIYSDIAKSSHFDYKKAGESLGWKYLYERGVQATETDFTADVVRMRQAGVKMIFLVAVDVNLVSRLAKAMQQQNFRPEQFVVWGPGYDPKLPTLAGTAVEGMYNLQPYSMFAGEDAGVIPEVRLFNEWLGKVRPGYKPDLFAAFAWASGRLLFQAMEEAGPTADRAAVITALNRIKEFSANDLLAPAGPAEKRPPQCFIITQIKGGKYQRVDTPPAAYRCNDGPYLIFKQ